VECLQEVTPKFVKEFLVKDKWITSNYKVSDSDGSTVQPYGVVLLSKHAFDKLYFVKLPTYMDRSLLVAEYTINSVKFGVATVHLESLGTAPIRKQQLEIISKHMQRWPTPGEFIPSNLYAQSC